VRWAFQVLLQSAGLNVQTFSSARDFLDNVDVGDKGVVILDVRMPGETGLDVMKRLASKKSRMKVIAVSASDDTPTRDLASELGAMAFFRKPVHDQALIDTIEWAMRQEKP
jgi:two-component system response regulator FixJ